MERLWACLEWIDKQLEISWLADFEILSTGQAAIREAREETGVELNDLQVVRRGLNSYGRYCHLVRATSDDLPSDELDPREVAWAAYHPIEDLHARRTAGELTFVDGFFEDLSHALSADAP